MTAVTTKDSFRQRISKGSDAVRTLVRARLLTGMRPDKYLRLAAAFRRNGPTNTFGITMSAVRCPERIAVIDEIGELTYRQLNRRGDALAAAWQQLPSGQPKVVGVMCRNHRGLIEAMYAADKIGASVLLLNTSFAGPALDEVVSRECPDLIVYDEEFTEAVGRAAARPHTTAIVAWEEGADRQALTVESLIASHLGERPTASQRKGKLILLTSGTTGSPKGAARRPGGDVGQLTALLARIPWRAEETVVVAAPLFHAWGLFQFVLATLLSCTLVLRRKFDPDTTMKLVDRHRATGLSVVPVMLDRIMEASHSGAQYRGSSLRFVSASGSRMRADVVTAFMNRFGDVVYNSYNATEVGMIATATPADLCAAPDTAGRPMGGVDLRILDAAYQDLPAGNVGQIFARSSSHFDGYTSGSTKHLLDGFMATGDLGYLDGDGRLFVVGRDDEMIVSGGENVYPIEVERALSSHAGVEEAVVMGVDDERFGQRLAALVVRSADSAITAEQLREHVRENLANYKVPREISFVAELPRSSTGKVVRAALRAMLDDATSP